MHGGEEVLPLDHGLDVGARLGELLAVVLQDVPVALQRMVDRRRLRLLGSVLGHAVIHLGKPEKENVLQWKETYLSYIGNMVTRKEQSEGN